MFRLAAASRFFYALKNIRKTQVNPYPLFKE